MSEIIIPFKIRLFMKAVDEIHEALPTDALKNRFITLIATLPDLTAKEKAYFSYKGWLRNKIIIFPYEGTKGRC